MEPIVEETAVVKEWQRIETDDEGYAYWSMRVGSWEFKVCPVVDWKEDIVPDEFYAEAVWPNGEPVTCGYYESLADAKEGIVVQFNLVLLKWMNATSGGSNV